MKIVIAALSLILLTGCVSGSWNDKYNVDADDLLSAQSIAGITASLRSGNDSHVSDAIETLHDNRIVNDALNDEVVKACYATQRGRVIQEGMEFLYKTKSYTHLLKVIRKGLTIYHHETQALAARYAYLCTRYVDIASIKDDLEKVTKIGYHRKTRKNALQALGAYNGQKMIKKLRQNH